MRLPGIMNGKVQYILERTDDIRKGAFRADKRWLDCIDKVLDAVPSDGMREFYEQYFCKGLSNDDIQYNLFIERSTLYSWRDYFLWHVALEATALGLVDTSCNH